MRLMIYDIQNYEKYQLGEAVNHTNKIVLRAMR